MEKRLSRVVIVLVLRYPPLSDIIAVARGRRLVLVSCVIAE